MWNLARIVLQAVSLILTARVLGADGYGALAGSVALFMTFGQLTGLGSGVALVRHMARGGELHRRFAVTVRAYLFSGLALLALVWPLSIILLGTNVTLAALACFAFAEVLIAPALSPLVYRYQAEERMFLSSAIGTLAPMARLAAVICLALLGSRSITGFALLYLVLLSLTVGISLFAAWPRGGNTHGREGKLSTRQAIREGAPYVISGVALTAGSELDKTVLLRLAGAAVVGPYAAAYRIASAATLPINALILAASPRLFRTPSANNSRLAAFMLLAVVAYSVIAATTLWLLAPFAAQLLGRGFSDSTVLLRALCAVVITGSLRQYASALLTTRDLQKGRNIIEISGMSASLALLILLIPSDGAHGAIAALVLSDLFVILSGAILLMEKSKTSTYKKSTRNILRKISRTIEYTGTGRWIYTNDVLSWCAEESITSQFPASLRAFLIYSRIYNKYIRTRTIIFGHGLYKLSIRRGFPNATRIVIRGKPIWLNLNDPGALNAVNELYQGSCVSREIEHFCAGADLFIDIGSNQGAMTAVAERAMQSHGRIIAIEPQKSLADCVSLTLQEIMPNGKWNVFNVAVGNDNRLSSIVVPKENFGEAQILDDWKDVAENSIQITSDTLDNILISIDPRSKVVIKMDIEGREYAALAGGRSFLSLHKPTIIMEINPSAMVKYGYTQGELTALLKDLGYRYWRPCGDGKKIQSINCLPTYYCDIVLTSQDFFK